MTSSAKRIASMGVFLALGICLNMFSFTAVSFFGTISFVYAFCYLSGIIFGPLSGGVVAALSDLIPALIFPKGPWMPLLTVSNAMIAVITGVCNRHLKLPFAARLIIGSVLSYLICTCTLTVAASLPIYDYFPTAKIWAIALGIESKYASLLLYKALTQIFWVIFNTVITYTMATKLKIVIEGRSLNGKDRV